MSVPHEIRRLLIDQKMLAETELERAKNAVETAKRSHDQATQRAVAALSRLTDIKAFIEKVGADDD